MELNVAKATIDKVEPENYEEILENGNEGNCAYAEKLVPQPQVSLAFGLLNVNPRLFRPST